ncbi:ABC transporter ATP-binding protein [Fodinibius sediminis]|uniref:Putative ABC transport system ATP-binding protein n=1 Tax=Fodinibius sediminis TaxID=1214077 RepID=A0A521BQ10_9BACT|nr:ABC transporter ATP-binding protein [Fodinibius sediminis]SMO49155.1 putative ABC transport system ATP-binding protein [Fodinibius sediminis]
MSALLDISHVSKIYRKGEIETRVLEDINLRVQGGDFIALMGPSGSGKSTLLNIISGLDTPTTGEVVVNGRNITGLSESALSAWRLEHVGFIFQQYHLMPVLTAFENVELPLLLFNLGRSERKSLAEAALSIVGLEDRTGYYPRQLSGGQQQRVCIARAIVTDPLIIIADEPTGNLDYDSTNEVLALFDTLNQDLGKTIIMVTHDPHAAERAGDIRYLQKGLIVENERDKRFRSDDLEASHR